MISIKSVPFGTEPLPSLPFVNRELKRIPTRAKMSLASLGLREDFVQELHLAYYEKTANKWSPDIMRRALHAAGERFRYREVVRRAKYEVREELAGAKYHRLMYGTEPENNWDNE